MTRASRDDQFFLYPEDRAQRLANIMGPNSSAALALAELSTRRLAGENAVIMTNGKMLLVGPDPRESDDASSKWNDTKETP